MTGFRRPSKEEVRERRAALAERIRSGGLPMTEAVRQMRHALGLSQGEFAELADLTKRQLAEIEQGKANPTVATLQRLGRLFGLEVGFVKAEPANRSTRRDRRDTTPASIPEGLAEEDELPSPAF